MSWKDAPVVSKSRWQEAPKAEDAPPQHIKQRGAYPENHSWLGPAKTQDTSPRFIPEGNFGAGMVENLTTMVTGAGSAVAGGLAGLARTLFPGEEGSGARLSQAIQEGGTYQPRSQPGQRIAQGIQEGPVGQAFGAIERGSQYLGDRTLEATGSPLAATAAYTAPTALLEGVGLLGAGAFRPRRLAGATPEVRRELAQNPVRSIEEIDLPALQQRASENALRQQQRADTFEQAGLTGDAGPTRAQLTRDATDFQKQQEAAKTSSGVRERLENQEAVIANQFDETISKTGGSVANPSSSAINEVVGRSTALDQQISEFYKLARESAPDAMNVKPDGLVAALRSRSGSDKATNGLIKSIWGDLKARGILQKGELRGSIDVQTAEQIRQFINSHYDSTTPLGRSFIHDLKNALDDDVLRVAGEDVFSGARKAKAEFEAGLRRAKVSKFDSRKANLVRDMLENKIDPDKFVDSAVFGGKYRAEDLGQLKAYLDQTDAGKAAWRDLQAETLYEIKNRAFIGPEDANGYRMITRDSLERALGKVGDARLNVLFDDEITNFLKLMDNLAKIREPVRGTALGKGPSAQAVGELQAAIMRNPYIRGVVTAVTLDHKGRVVMRGNPAQMPDLKITPNATPGLVTGGVLASEKDRLANP